MIIALSFNCTNAAFDGPDPMETVARMMECLASEVRHVNPDAGWERVIRDDNGNSIGCLVVLPRISPKQGLGD